MKSPFTGLPTIFIYDRIPGGIGFSTKLYELHDELLQAARALVTSCGCLNGCPSCVGPAIEVGARGKQRTLEMLRVLAAR